MVGSAQGVNGRVSGPGAKARCGRDPGSRQVRRRVENALESENRQESVKKGFEIDENL